MSEKNDIIIDPSESTGRIVRKILRLAYPVILSNLLYTVESAFSIILVSGLGESEVAAVGFSASLLWFIYSLMALSYTGTSVLVAQKTGAGEKVEGIVGLGLIVSFIIALPLTFFGKDLVLFIQSMMGASDRVLELSGQYLEPIFLFITVGFLTNTIYGALNGRGNTKTTFKVAIIMNVVNITTSYLLIYGNMGFPQMGVKGAGVGIVLSEIVGFLIYLYLLVILKRPFTIGFSIKTQDILSFFRIGFPTMIERVLTTLSFNIFVGLLAPFGDHILAAHQIGLRIESVSFMVGFGFMVASSIIAGQNFGAKNFYGVKKGVFITAVLSSLFMGLLGIVFILFPDILALPFTRDPDIIKYASYYLIIVGISQIPLSLAFIFSGGLKGMGKTHIPLFINILSFWLFRIAPSYLILKIIYSPLVPWVMMTIETFLRCFMFFLFFKRYTSSPEYNTYHEKKDSHRNEEE